jgi:iron complex outermembrane receptor protein
MNIRHARTLGILGKAALFAGCALAASPAFAQTGGTQLEEIVVTAQKREQNLQDVPISITALGASALQANRVVDVRDLNAVAPNLTVRVASGGSSQANYSMRGLVTAGSAPGSDKGISIYLDGVYLQATNGGIFDFADMERIEVLKGPQGTLFGRNATGGAISVITRNPTGQFGVHQELSFGNYNQFRTKTRIDLPQVGPVAAAFTFVHSERQGDTENLGAGTVWDWTRGGQGYRVAAKRLGDQDVDGFFGTLRFDLLQNLDLSYKFDYTQNHYTPEAQGMAYLDSPLIGAVILASQPNPGLLTPITNQRPDAINNWFSTPSYSFAWGHNVTAVYHFTDQISVKNIFAYRRSGVNSTYQLDGLGGLQVTPAMAALGLAAPSQVGTPWTLLGNTAQSIDEQWSDEVQLNWNNRWFSLTAGYIHFDYKVAGTNFEGVPNVMSFTSTPDFVIPALATLHTNIHTKSDAVFAQIEGHLTSQIDLVAGYRLTRDEKSGVDNSVQDPLGASVPIPLSYKNSRPTWLGGINYRPIEGVMTYVKYATGFISGGELASVTYQPETAKSWEVGVKADLLDRRLRTNLALFDVKYGDLQFQTSGFNVNPPINASIVLVNAGNAKAKGFEWENTFIPLDGLTLTANVGYTDFKYTEIDPIIGSLDWFLPISRPKWTGNLAAQYDSRELYAGGHLVFRLDANYRSKTYLGYSPTLNQAAVDAVTTDDSWIVNGRVAFADFDLAGAKAQAAIWARNIFDNKDLANDSTLVLGAIGNIYPGSFERARTFGVDLMVDF